MRINDILLEYDRERARQALGDGLWKAALRDQFRLWFKPLDQLKDLRPTSISPNAHKFIMDVFDRPDMQRDVADRALQNIEAADPSTNKKYTQWMARQFATGNVAKMEDVESTLASAVAKFHFLNTRKKLPTGENDINRYKTANELYDNMKRYLDPEIIDKGVSSTEYEDDSVTVIEPRNTQAACYWGAGTRWCTAVTGDRNYFIQYHNQGPLYILIPKRPKHEGEKYQLHFQSEQYMDENDETVDLRYLLDERFPGLLEFFMKQRGAAKVIQDMVQFADDDVLDRLTDEIWELTRDKVFDVLSDWEANDDSYFKWLNDQGYIDEDGDVSNSAPSYLEYNDEARRWESNMEEWINVSPKQLRKIAARAVDVGGFDGDSIYDIVDYLTWNIQDNLGRRESDGGIPDWMGRNIEIARTSYGPQAKLYKQRARP